MGFLEDEAFGELRSRLQQTPSTAGFVRVCRAAQRMEERSPGLFASRYADYTRSTLDTWPRHHRTLSSNHHAKNISRLAWSPLVRGLHIEVSDFGALNEVVAPLEGLEHLGMRGNVKQKPLLAAIDD